MEYTEDVKKVLAAVEAGTSPNEMEGELEQIVGSWSCSDGFEYAIYEGGYAKPEQFFVGEDLEKMKAAIALVGEFKNLWRDVSIEF